MSGVTPEAADDDASGPASDASGPATDPESTGEARAGTAAGGWRIPRRLLLPALLVGVILSIPVVGAYVFAGAAAALLVGLAYGAAVPLAVGLPISRGVALSVPVALVAVIAAAVGPSPLPAAGLVAVLVLLTIPGSPLGGAALVGIPTTAAVLVALPVRLDPGQVGLWTLLGSIAVVALLGLFLRGRPLPSPAPVERGVLHAVVSAAAVGLVVWAVLQFQVPHGYWAAMTLTLVLRRARDETTLTARRRVVGTVLGAVVAVPLAAVLPQWAAGALLFLLLVGVVGYALVGNYTLQVACLTPMIILLGSASGGAAQLAAERVLATIAGALAAGAVGALVLWLEARLGSRAKPAEPVPPEGSGVAG